MRMAYRRPPRLDGFEEVIRGLIINILREVHGVDAFELDGFLNNRILGSEVAPIGATMLPPVDEGHCRALVAAAFTTLVRRGSIRFATSRNSIVIVASDSPRAVR
jgi:hypothetical protein